MDKTVQTVTEAAKQVAVATKPLQDKLIEVIDQIQASIIKVAPDALNITLEVTRMNCLVHILEYIMVCIVFGIPGSICLLKLITHIKGYINWRTFEGDKAEPFRKYKNSDDTAFFLVFPALFCSIVIASNLYYINFWYFIGVLEPKLYLAKELVNKVLN